MKSSVFNIPIRKIDPGTITSAVLKIIPEDSARIYHFVSIGITDGVVEIGIVDPENVQAIDVLTFITAKLDKPSCERNNALPNIV